MNRAGDIALCVWFLLVAFAFWGPYLGLYLSGPLSAVYALMLVGAIVAVALRLLNSPKA
jgi:hypothetical protein